MKITNKYNLPQSLVNAVNETHIPQEKRYSVTTILNPIREIMLNRRHYNEIEQDVSDMIWLIFGSAIHKYLENADETGNVEMHLEAEVIDGYMLTGITDLYNEEEMTVEDWKTGSVWKVIHQEFDDWKKQGLMYAWLLRKLGKYTKRIRFHDMLKDWTAKDARFNKDYPQHPIYTYEHEITEDDMVYIESFIKEQFIKIIEAEKLKDDDLPMCSMEERWNSGDKYAVKKIGNKKALKVCDTKEDAETYLQPGYEIEVRPGEDRKCVDYCLCHKYCKYWKEKYGTIN